MGQQCSTSNGSSASAYRGGGGESGDSDLPTATLLPRHHHGAVLSCSFLSPSAIVTGGDDKSLAITHLRPTPASPAEPIKVLKSHEGAVNTLHVFHPPSSPTPMVLSASRDTTVKLWGGSSKPVGNFLGHNLSVMAVGAHKDGNMVASGARDYMVKVWDTNTCQCTSTSKVRPSSTPRSFEKSSLAPLTPSPRSLSKVSRNLVTCLKFWDDGSYRFAQGSEDLTMRVWDVRFITNNSTNASCAVTFGKYLYFPLDVDVSKCGNHVVSSSKGFDGSGCEGRVWDIRSPDKPLHVLNGHTQDAVG